MIAVGLLLVVLAQFWLRVPVVAALALVGWGAVLTLHQRPRTSRQDSLSIVHLTIYSSLICLAIVAQSNCVLQESGNRIHPTMLIDHAAAIVMLIGLAAHVAGRISQPLTE